MTLSESLRAKLTEIIGSDDVVLFMKGSRRMPQCGFSSTVVQILDGHLPKYTTVNVLSDPEIRDGIKQFSNWPTIPQLYVKGEFLGGCDIVREMQASGELAQKLAGVKGTAPAATGPATPPNVKVSDSAAKALKSALEAEGEGQEVHIEIGTGYEYGLYVGPRAPGDVEAKANGITLLFDAGSARRAEGLSIDFIVGEGDGGGFRLESPSEPPRVRQLSPADLKKMQERGDKFELFDVRTPRERATASITGARLLDEETLRHIEGLPKDTLLVFHCHHGGRSQAAAERFLAQGYHQVFNLKGGIDAWSLTVDPSVPRY
ncbi:Grx4 family monothiol glutaredoxin [Chondromyces crocatus]|uniref:Probable monothiol glutaredoxin 2 n=1 Tax=Chondromyces crocatus TaxID=52 RepID=A0A0K1EP58_CHOCO|nr:Grx4 family monothiol glutaredoxin [Chondromyces crocatus]AKT42631.1 glutaredoxin [Chondromyces crocatus]